MPGWLARILRGDTPSPAEQVAALQLLALEHEIERGLAAQRARRLTREATRKTHRFDRARAKVEQLQREMATQQVVF